MDRTSYDLVPWRSILVPKEGWPRFPMSWTGYVQVRNKNSVRLPGPHKWYRIMTGTHLIPVEPWYYPRTKKKKKNNNTVSSFLFPWLTFSHLFVDVKDLVWHKKIHIEMIRDSWNLVIVREIRVSWDTVKVTWTVVVDFEEGPEGRKHVRQYIDLTVKRVTDGLFK